MSDKKTKNKTPSIRTFAQDLEKYKNKAEKLKRPAPDNESGNKNTEKDLAKNIPTKMSVHSLTHHVSEKEALSSITKNKPDKIKNKPVTILDGNITTDSGITLNNSNKDQKDKHGTEKIIKQDYQAKIIRETKEHKSKTSFVEDIKNWWSNLTTNKKNKKHTYSVPKSTYRKGVVEKATSKSGAVFTSDSKSLREEIKNRQTKNPKPVRQSPVKEITAPDKINEVDSNKKTLPEISEVLNNQTSQIDNIKPETNATNEIKRNTKLRLSETEVKKETPLLSVGNSLNSLPAPTNEVIEQKSHKEQTLEKDRPKETFLKEKIDNNQTKEFKPEIEQNNHNKVSMPDTILNNNIGYGSVFDDGQQNLNKNFKEIAKDKKEVIKKDEKDETPEEKQKPLEDLETIKIKTETVTSPDYNKTKDVTIVEKGGNVVSKVTVHKEKFIDRVNINAIAMTILFFALCAVLIYFGFKNVPQLIERYNEVTADKPEKSKAKKIFTKSDELKSIILTTTNIDKLPNLILDSVDASSTIKTREIAIVAPDGSEISASYLFNLLNFNTKPSMRGEIKLFRFISLENSDPILILKFNDKQTIYGGLLDWENDMLRNLSILYKNYDIESYNNVFSDKEILNYNTRISYNEDGEIILLYGFINNTVIIANSENLFIKTVELLSQ